jgi:hypothetical protein
MKGFTMGNSANDLARRLARNAEAVCRHYLSKGRRSGRYWVVGDIMNTPGRSLYVRLIGPEFGKGAAGKWTDAATAEHGDLLDIIAKQSGLTQFTDIAAEALRFLGAPETGTRPPSMPPYSPIDPAEHSGSARRLFAMSKPISRTIAETYLRNRGIEDLRWTESLRFHPNCYHRTGTDAGTRTEAWPAMIAAVTDNRGTITGVHRTWLDPSGRGKAPLETPRRAIGDLLGHGVRFGITHDVMAVGEGIETILSLRSALPNLPMAAALSANHLGAFLIPASLRRIYVARDNDPAGDKAYSALAERAAEAGIEAFSLMPALRDFNDDLRHLGLDELCAALRVQLVPEDVPRFCGFPPINRPGS